MDDHRLCVLVGSDHLGEESGTCHGHCGGVQLATYVNNVSPLSENRKISGLAKVHNIPGERRL